MIGLPETGSGRGRPAQRKIVLNLFIFFLRAGAPFISTALCALRQESIRALPQWSIFRDSA